MQNFQEAISVLSLVSWAIFGFISGFIAHLVEPSVVSGGLPGTVVAGVLGALIGGFLASAFLGVAVTGLNLVSFEVAVAGSLLVAFMYQAIRRTIEGR